MPAKEFAAMVDAFDPAEVSFDYPLWTFTRAGSVPTIGHPNIDSMMPAVFTDCDAALRYLEESRMTDAQPLEIKDPAFLLAMLDHFKSAGKRYVAFDLWLHTGTGQIVPIDLFIEGVRQGAP
jgi:hypothetical protein